MAGGCDPQKRGHRCQNPEGAPGHATQLGVSAPQCTPRNGGWAFGHQGEGCRAHSQGSEQAGVCRSQAENNRLRDFAGLNGLTCEGGVQLQ